MPRVVIKVPSEIDKEKIEFWIAEGMGRELFKNSSGCFRIWNQIKF